MGKQLRVFTGYFIILVMLPIFIMLVFFTSFETKKVQSLHEVLEENIHIKDIQLPQTSYIKAGDGSVISEIARPLNRIYLSSDEISSFLENLFIISEDQHFYDHPGFDLPAMGRALAINIQANEIEQGASTITQQLARNLYLNHEQSYNRKLSELLYAYELERKYSKKEILELYINAIYFHNGAYGIEAASNLYFQKQTKELSKAQLAFLASIPNNPAYYDPLSHFDRTKKRQERMIDQLRDHKLLSSEEAEHIKKEPIVLNLKKRIDQFPDYVTYVEEELKELISAKEQYNKRLLGANKEDKNRLEAQLEKRIEEVVANGIIIETALNPDIQQNAKKAVESRLPYPNVEGAAAVINHKRHELVALIGGKHYKKYDFNRGFQAYRQPGSSIKPLLVYAPYIERTHASLSEKVNAGSFCRNGYCPQNFGGARYGMVTLERAFIHSYNTPAVRLLDTVGIEESFRDLALFGFEKVSREDHVLAAAVGGFSFGMTPLELTSAYTVFANNGYFQPARAIRKVTSLQGEVLYTWDDQPIKVWSKDTSDKIRQLLKKTVQAGTARKAYLPNGYSGGKTGTTNGYKDYWFVGLTNQLTAGIWVGKDTPESMLSIQSEAPQLLIWKDIMLKSAGLP